MLEIFWEIPAGILGTLASRELPGIPAAVTGRCGIYLS